ncbi:heavy-metal-associated domain-containing protein [Rufibacter quisquiliarum]|uniref:Copper chaperone n=1 Tax=Rufibacter quisquiliarum TaxID=1549639 RepID=A0A839GJ21_9BACT|nr:cation transporter [Rufibacter quisquiliarum]MBA9078852.1 copper chaperone [Rufibacter quisquiliarum]
MSTLKFKTNIKCGGCISAVTPTLDATPGVENWAVDTNNPDKILTVQGNISEEEVVAAVNKAGYNATPVQE